MSGNGGLQSLPQRLNDLSPEQLAILSVTPLFPPPSGSISNFVNPPNRIALQLGLTAPFLGLALLLYSNRLYVKIFLVRSWTWDDVTLFIAVLGGIQAFVLRAWGVTQAYMARHIWDISVLQFISANMSLIFYLDFVLSPMTLLFLKSTFFLLYLHLFKSVPGVRISCWFCLAFTLLFHLAIIIHNFVLARPADIKTLETKAAVAVHFPWAVIGLFVDILIFIIPIVAIVPLTLTRRKKIGALLMFTTGLLGVACSAILIPYRKILMDVPVDSMWVSIPSSILSQIEIFIGIMCASFPAISHSIRHPNSIYRRFAFRVKAIPDFLISKWSTTTSHSPPHLSNGNHSLPQHALRSIDRKYPTTYMSLCSQNFLGGDAHQQELQDLEAAHVSRGRNEFRSWVDAGHDHG